jgi:A/G-specific adenine glycosylase
MKTQFRRGALQRSLLKWFDKNRRALPWRANRNPYRIWIAEIMLQQTRIAAVIPYYERFLERFPTVDSLAAARVDDVLLLWSGLGYYSRARNLHRAAQQIVAEHLGEFPRGLDAALDLPGIGHYTAAAILSIAYDVPLAVLDGNVARVLARLGSIRGDLRQPSRWRALASTTQHLLAPHAPGDWNQALMELGEVICTPRNPGCDACPIAKFCRARALRLTDRIPAPRRKRAPVKIRIAAAILCDPKNRVLLVRDPGAHDGVLFSRMWQFPAIEVAVHAQNELAAHLAQTLGFEPPALEQLPSARHGVTYRNIALLPFLASVAQLPKLKRTRILHLDRLSSVPISSATRKIAAALQQNALENSPAQNRVLANRHRLLLRLSAPLSPQC